MTKEHLENINKALKIAEDLFETSHPTTNRPLWIQKSLGFSYTVTKDHTTLSYRRYLEKITPLEVGDAWEITDRGRRLVNTDPVTGERKFILTRDHHEFLDVFCVSVELDSGLTKVIVDTPIQKLTESDFVTY